MTVKELIEESYKCAMDKGWWPPDESPNFPEKIALMHSELSEALEEYRNGHALQEVYYVDKNGQQKPEGIPIELADVLIRIADLCGHYNIDIEAAIKAKQEYNRTRPVRHGGKLC